MCVISTGARAEWRNLPHESGDFYEEFYKREKSGKKELEKKGKWIK